MEMVERVGGIGEAVIRADDGRDESLAVIARARGVGRAPRRPRGRAEEHHHHSDGHRQEAKRGERNQQKCPAQSHGRTVSDAFGRGE